MFLGPTKADTNTIYLFWGVFIYVSVSQLLRIKQTLQIPQIPKTPPIICVSTKVPFVEARGFYALFIFRQHVFSYSQCC